MIRATYLRYDLLRNFRNWQFLLLTLAFPVILYLAVAGSHQHNRLDGVAFPLAFISGMAALGTMAATISSGSVIAAERSTGWMRQMRITPLTASGYFSAKVLCAYLRALLTIAVMCLAGVTLGVHLSPGGWLTMIGLLLVGLIPFAVLGILHGHLLNTAASTPAVGGITTLFALLGGAYGFQLAKSGALLQITKALPSFWLVQTGKAARLGIVWPAEGWIVIAAWTAALALLAVLAYRRDTTRT
jgi:ABC-2 type transport system permease protein